MNEPWLCLDGTELANATRTLTYLASGLGGAGFDVGLPPSGCYCDLLDDGPYVDPVTDDAPWYTMVRPDSEEFLGVMPMSIEARPTLQRAMSHGALGASLGPARAGGYIVAVTALLAAASSRGMKYGERWVTDMLAGSLCDDERRLTLLPACTDDDYAMPPWRSLPRVGLVDGPVFQSVGVRDCNLKSVSFQMGSESPWLEADPITIASGVVFTGSATSYLMETADWVGDAGVRIVVTAGPAGATNFAFECVVIPDGVCPPTLTRPECWSFSVPSLPGGHQLIVDGMMHTAEVRNPATQHVIGGLDYLDYAGLFRYPEIAPCTQVCLTAHPGTASTGTTLDITQINREL